MAITSMRPARRNRGFAAFTLAAAGSLALAGCGGSSSSASRPPALLPVRQQRRPPARAAARARPARIRYGARLRRCHERRGGAHDRGRPPPTRPSAAARASTPGQTLNLWDYELADSALGKARALAIKDFIASHPGVTVKYQTEVVRADQLQRLAHPQLGQCAGRDGVQQGQRDGRPALQAGSAHRPDARGQPSTAGTSCSARACRSPRSTTPPATWAAPSGTASRPTASSSSSTTTRTCSRSTTSRSRRR